MRCSYCMDEVVSFRSALVSRVAAEGPEGLSVLTDITVDLDLVPGLKAFGVQRSALEMC